MTRVEFHSDIAAPVHFACRLLRKAYGQGKRVLVTAPPQTLLELDAALWTFDAQSFIPHRRLQPGASTSELARTPVWLAGDAALRPCPPVLVNIGAPAAADLEAFDRVVEIVGTDAEAVQQARGRWRDYAARGLKPSHRSQAAAAAQADE